MITWHKMFVTGEIPNDISDKELCAEALNAWGSCSLATRPENFGKAMSTISSRLGIPAIPENLMKYAKDKGY